MNINNNMMTRDTNIIFRKRLNYFLKNIFIHCKNVLKHFTFKIWKHASLTEEYYSGGSLRLCFN